MKNSTLKSIFTLVMMMTLTTGFLTGCDKKSGGNPNSGVYDPYNPNGGYYSNYRYAGNLQVSDRTSYRDFIQGDICRSKRRDCKRVDGNPLVQIGFKDLKFVGNQPTYGYVTYNFRNRNYPQYDMTSASYPLVFQKTANGRIIGYAQNANPRNGIGARVEYVLRGNPSLGFRVQVLYDGYLMLEGRLTLSR